MGLGWLSSMKDRDGPSQCGSSITADGWPKARKKKEKRILWVYLRSEPFIDFWRPTTRKVITPFFALTSQPKFIDIDFDIHTTDG